MSISSMQKQLDEATISYRELREESELTKRRLMSAAESAAAATSASQHAQRSRAAAHDNGISWEESHRRAVERISTGDLIAPSEAALGPSAAAAAAAMTRASRPSTRMSGHISEARRRPPSSSSFSAAASPSRSYEAPTISSLNQVRSATPPPPQQAGSEQAARSRAMEAEARQQLESTIEGIRQERPILRPEQVPDSVDIHVDELNRILGAVGRSVNPVGEPRKSISSSVQNNTGIMSNDSSRSLSADSLIYGRPPGGNAAGNSRAVGADSSDSSMFSVERQLQRLVDTALDPVGLKNKPATSL